MTELQQAAPYQNDDDEIDLRELFRVLWAGKWLIGGITLAAAVIAVIVALMLPNIYRAEALLAPNDQEGAGGLSALAAQYGGLASLYEPGSSRDDFINLSRGMIRLADNNRAYVVRPDRSILASNSSRFFRSHDSDDIGPGDTIVVPLRSNPISTLSLLSSVTSIFCDIEMAAAAVAAF